MKPPNKLSCRHAFTQTLTEEAARDNRIYAVTTDARGSVTLNDFANQLPDQFFELGIAEQNAAGVSAGLGLSGKNTFLCGPACFHSARNVEQIKNDIAYSNANVKIVGVSGGVSYGALGSTHHSLHDIALYRSIPNISIILPADFEETVLATKFLAEHDRPVYMRLGRSPVPDVYDGNTRQFIFGKANILKDGSDCTIVATGETVAYAVQAAELLKEEGFTTAVLDVHTIKPLDEEKILEFAEKTGCIISVEEHSIYGGLGGAISELLACRKPTPMKIIGFQDEFLPAGNSKELFLYAGITAEHITKQTIDLIKTSK